MLFLGANILRKFEYRATMRLFMMMILIMTFYANWNVQQLSRPLNHWQRAFLCPWKRGVGFFIIITRPKSVHYHLHIEMAYFLRVHNAHHGKKHNRDQWGDRQRKKLKDPGNSHRNTLNGIESNIELNTVELLETILGSQQSKRRWYCS